MGKTFRNKDGRRPKWDKHGQKSKKQRDFEEDQWRHQPYPRPSHPEIPETNESQ